MREAAGQQGVALVIGGAGGVGREVVGRLRLAGWTVAATARSAQRPDDGVTWVEFDALRPGTAGPVREVLAGLGPLRLVVFCQGAGSSKRTIVQSPAEEFTRCFAVNVMGLVAVWSAVHELARDGMARIVILSSDAARSSGAGNGPYSAAKAALESVAATLAREEASFGVRVNVVAPAIIDNEEGRRAVRAKGVRDVDAYFHGLAWHRALTNAEVADVAVTVGTEPGWAYMTGQTVRIAATLWRSRQPHDNDQGGIGDQK
jgi:NAD(P)-dependent dehydrogenase (short-subunit alcohol dehydrogenase family)